MKEIELEKVYLVKNLPENIVDYEPMVIQVGDFFDSNSVNALKIRRKGDKFQLIKKESGENEYQRTEHTIFIKKEEFEILWKQVGQNHSKLRFFYPWGEHTCEIDYYKDRLDGYVRVEVEFKNVEDMENFVAPEWFGDEITKLNHEIHEDLGLVTLDEMKERFAKNKIELARVNLPKK
jgi:CYTH domain-containing protein